jgi:hypothetical protein
MPAKILAFDPNRRIPPRHYTPIAMRGRLLIMPPQPDAGAKGDSNASPVIPDDCLLQSRKFVASASRPYSAKNEFRFWP